VSELNFAAWVWDRQTPEVPRQTLKAPNDSPSPEEKSDIGKSSDLNRVNNSSQIKFPIKAGSAF